MGKGLSVLQISIKTFRYPHKSKSRLLCNFFPEDGHRPQINDGQNDSVLKPW